MTEPAAPVPINILSFDGGGIRGYSSLQILEEVMLKIQKELGLLGVPKPCDYFDLIGGTSTGGIISILLGRLRLTVGEALEAYDEVASKAFVPRVHFLGKPKYDAKELEKVVQDVIQKKTGDADTLFGDKDGSKTVVLAITKVNVDAPPTLFRTYDNHPEWQNCKIWEVARATSAALTYFNSIKLGRGKTKVEFMDAGFGNNNPCATLVEEAREAFPERPIGCILSIGTGLGRAIEVSGTMSILPALGKMATSSRGIHRRMEGGEYRDRYHRLDENVAVSDIKLDDYKKMGNLAGHTRNYLLETDTKDRITQCVQAIRVTRNEVKEEENAKLSQFELDSSQNYQLIHEGAALPYSKSPLLRHDGFIAQADESNVYFEIPLDTNKNFVKRTKLASQIKQFLLPGELGSEKGRRIVLFGLGGSGKTEMAVRFAERHRNNYVAVFWVDGRDEAQINHSFFTIAQILGLDAGESSKEVVLRKVRTWFSTHRKWLLIIDNLDDDVTVDLVKRKYLNAGMRGDVLITSRNASAATAARWDSIEVSDMEPHEATELLKNVACLRVTDEAELLDLSNDLGHLPLALDQAASFIFETGISVSDYRKLFAAQRDRLLKHYPSTHYNQEHRHNVMTTWEISFNHINPKAAKLLMILSLLYVDEIPEQILESALKGQYYWAQNGEFVELPRSEYWIPDDLQPMFYDQIYRLEAIAALKKFSFLRLQADSSSYRMHPLVQFWASQRLAGSPTLMRQLMICAIGLVAGCFEELDRLPPLSQRTYGERGLEDSTLRLWPWRQYQSLAPHALQCLKYARTIDQMPECAAHFTLSLLQVLEYSTFGSLKVDQEISLPLVDHLERFQTSPDSYLQLSAVIWRLSRTDLCRCRKHIHQFAENIDLDSDIPNRIICKNCTSSYSKAKLLECLSRRSPRTDALKRSIRFRLESDRCWNYCFAPEVSSSPTAREQIGLPRSKRTPPFQDITGCGTSRLERYENAVRQYLKMRSADESGISHDPYNSGGDSTDKELYLATEEFRTLCGPSSEEFRRSQFYTTSMMIYRWPGPADSYVWNMIEDALKPLIEASIECPVHSWSHERCVIRYIESLLKQGKEEKASIALTKLARAYSVTGRQLRAVEGSYLLKGRSENVVPKDMQIFVKCLTGRAITIQTNTCATVRSVLDVVNEKGEGNCSWSRLIFAGKQLDPSRFLSDYHIQSEATLHLVMRMAGGYMRVF